MNRTTIAALATAALLFSACGKKEQNGHDLLTQEQRATEGEEAMVGMAAPPHLIQESMANSMALFGAGLVAELAKQDPHANINISPWSIANALTLVSSAARGETLNELYQALGYNHVRHYDDYYARALKTLNEGLIADAQLPRPYGADESEPSPGSILSFANGLWMNEQLPFNIHPDFQRVVDTYFDAEVRKKRFADDLAGVRSEINQWIAQNTNDRIQDMVPQSLITPESVAIIVNAIAFKAAWADEFYEGATRPGDFRTSEGRVIQTPKMQRTIDRLNLVEDERFVAFDLPYAGHQYTMTLVLPKDGQHEITHNFLLNQRGFMALGPAMAQGQNVRVDLLLPKFSFDASADIRQTLEALGIRTPFSPSADFSGLYEGDARGMAITDILHQAFIDVNEKGTDAAAATVVAIALTSAPIIENDPRVIDVDRPFFFVIRDVRHSTPLFMGLVNNPAN